MVYITSCCRKIKSKLHEKMDLSRRAKFIAIITLRYCDILGILRIIRHECKNYFSKRTRIRTIIIGELNEKLINRLNFIRARLMFYQLRSCCERTPRVFRFNNAY